MGGGHDLKSPCICRCTQKIIISVFTDVAKDSLTSKTVEDQPINKNKHWFAAKTMGPGDIFKVR